MRCVTVRALVIALVAPVAAATLLAQSGASTATKKPAAAATAAAGAAPVIVVETEKGTFEFTTFPKEAPKSVDHIVTLVKRNFYNGQHFHRVVPDFVVQWGDPASKDMRNAGVSPAVIQAMKNAR